MKKGLKELVFIVLALSLIAPIVCASTSDFLVKVDSKNPITNQEDFAKYTLTIINNQTYDDTYTIISNDVEWSLKTQPLLDYTMGLAVDRQESKSTTLLVVPVYEVTPAKYNVGVFVRSQTTGKDNLVILPVEVLSKKINYPIDVTAELNSNELVDPRKKVSFQVVLTNNNARDLTNLEVSLKNELFSRKIFVELGPNEVKAIDFTGEIDKESVPGKYNISVDIYDDGKKVARDNANFELISYNIPFKKSIEVKESFLKKETIIFIENDGNVAREETINYPSNAFAKYFTTTEPNKINYDSNEKEYVFDITLLAKENIELIITEDYKPILYFVLFVVFYIVGYFLVRSPIVVRKVVLNVIGKENGISEIKLSIRIKNRSNKVLKNIKLIERIPHVGMPIENPNMQKPSRIYRYHQGIVVEWIFPEIGAKEETFIEYNIKTKLVVMGNLKLRPCVVRVGNNKAYSDPVTVYVPSKKQLKSD